MASEKSVDLKTKESWALFKSLIALVEIISKLNAQSRLETENYYIDLISGSIPQLTPAAPAQLPELSDGPHMAYALQWVFFAGLAGYGRILIRRTR